MSGSKDSRRLLREILSGELSGDEAAAVLDRLCEASPEELEELRRVADASVASPSPLIVEPDSPALERRILHRLHAELVAKHTITWLVYGLGGLTLALVRPLVVIATVPGRVSRRPRPKPQGKDPQDAP